MTKIPKRTRKKMNFSNGAECPICKRKGVILIEHHINGRNIPNPNHPSNLAYICSSCHDNIHFHKIIIEGWVKTTDGLELFWHSVDESSVTGMDSKPPLYVT